MPLIRYVLSEYVEHAIAQALYDKLEDGTFAGRIPLCKGVVAFGNTLRPQNSQEWRNYYANP